MSSVQNMMDHENRLRDMVQGTTNMHVSLLKKDDDWNLLAKEVGAQYENRTNSLLGSVTLPLHRAIYTVHWVNSQKPLT